jgi:hypothetical protein
VDFVPELASKLRRRMSNPSARSEPDELRDMVRHTPPEARSHEPTPRLAFGPIIAASFGVVARRWPALALVVGARFALTIGNHFVRFPPISHGMHSAETFSVGAGVSLLWECVDLLFNTALVAIALAPERKVSITGALAASARSFPALLPFQILSLLPWEVIDLWRQLFPPDFTNSTMILANVLFPALVGITFDIGLTAAWGLIAPVAVAERCGARAAFSRSWALLAGNRGVLAWLDVAMIVIGAVLTLVINLLSPTLLGTVGVPGARAYSNYSRWLASALSSMLMALWPVMTAVSYRRMRSGADPAIVDISDVFA